MTNATKAVTAFRYVLNRFEAAAQSERPFEAGYPVARGQVLEFVARLEAQHAADAEKIAELETSVTNLDKVVAATREAKYVVLELLAKCQHKANHGIPFYAYGDNEAACRMADLLAEIAGLAPDDGGAR